MSKRRKNKGWPWAIFCPLMRLMMPVWLFLAAIECFFVDADVDD